MSTVIITGGKLELPASIKRQLHLHDGDVLTVEVTPAGILLRPVDAPNDEERRHIRRGLADIAAGRVREVSQEELLALIDPADRP